MKRNFYLAGAVLMLIALWSRGALAAQADAWKADWEKSVEAAKKEGQLTLYGSPDFEGLFGEFHKKYPEIKITGVFNRGADVAKRLMAERRADKYLADLYVNGMTTGYNVFYKAKVLDPIPPLLVLPEVTDSSKWWRGKLHFCRSGKSVFVQHQRRESHGRGFQYQAGESRRDQILLGSAQSQVEKQDRRLRSDAWRLG